MKIKILIAALFISVLSWGQISIPNTTPVTENFDSMGTTAAATLPSNWKIGQKTAAPTWATGVTATTQQASSGSPTTGALYNWGATGGTDRALGVMTSSSFGISNSPMAYYRNTNTITLTQLSISYKLERYRVNTAAASVQFYYSTDGSTWTAVTAGDVVAASLPTSSSAYDYTPGLTVNVSFSITGLSLAPSSDIYLRWNLNTTGSNSQGIGIDDVSVTGVFGGSAPVVSGATPTITVGTPFSLTVSATNTPTSYAVASGTLPSGLSLDTTTGIISGTPTSAVTPVTVTITATNGYGTSTAATFTFTVINPVPVVTAASPTGTTGAAFSYTVSATNTPTSYAYTGTLAPGLSFNTTTGAITGTPTTVGSYPISVTATNTYGTSTAATISITIASPVPVVSGASLSGTTGSAFSYTIIATNSPTSYALASGTWPTGLSLNTATGQISGTPTVATTTSVTVTATNASGTSTAATLTFTFTPPVPVVTAATLTATVSSAYSYTVIATNSPTSYTLASGALPSGLSFNTTTGVISGTPTVTGSFSFTITATNAGGTSSAASFSLTVTAAACVVQGFSAGTTPPTGWSFTGISGTYTSLGNYGAASPALSMDTTNDMIVTEVLPAGNGASQLTFWIKGQGITSGSTSTLQVDGFDGTTWNNIEIINSATLISSSSTAITKTYNAASTPALPGNFVRFRFIYQKGLGNLAIDDVNIYCAPIAVVTPTVIGSAEIGTVGASYSYYVNASNFPTSYAIVAGSLPPGLSFNTTTGQISGAPTTAGSYSIDVTATNSGGTSASGTISFVISAYVPGCYSVTFEDGTSKTAYVADNITLNGKLWNLSEALIGGTATASDYGTGNYCVRMRSNFDAATTLIQDKAYGISTISFDYKKYGTDAYTNQLFYVEYSKDGGNSWIYVGSVAPSTSTSANFSASVNQSGPVRVRIRFALGTENNNVRINIDNLSVCDYTNTNEIEVFGNATTILNNSVTVSDSNNTYFSSAYFVGIDAPIVKTFVITNNGTGTLNLSGLSLSSTPYYTISSGLSSSALTAGQSATFSITFSSTATGLKSATVTINNDDADEGTFNFLISTKVYNYTRCTLLPTSYIAQQDFDSNVAYTYTADATNGNTTVAGGTNYGINRTTPSNMFIGTNSFQSKSQLNTITFAPVSTLNYQNIELDFNLGAYAVTTGEGMETSDYVMIAISTDGGVTFSPEVKVTGNSNSIFDINNTLSANSAKYKTSATNPTRFGTLTSSTNTTSGTFKITGLPSVADLRIAFTFLSNNANEVWALDNIAIKGQLPLTTTWDGTIWSPSAPTSSTKAVISGAYNTTTNGSVQACECQITSGYTMDVTANNYLEVQSNLNNAGTLNIASSGSLVQVNDDAVNTGSTNVSRTTTPYNKFDYTYWSTPVSGLTIGGPFSLWRTDYAFSFATANFADYNNDSFDDDNNAWQHVTTGTPMQTAQGYAIMAPTTGTFPATSSVTFSGPVNNGLISTPIVLSQNTGNANDDYNLIGNPYPSAFKADDFITMNTNISGTLYFWTHVTQISTANPGPDVYNFISADYAMYNLSGGTSSTTGSAQPNGYVASGEGFFVEAITPGNVWFNDSMRGKGYSNASFFKTNNAIVGVNAQRDRLWLDMQNPEGMFSQQLIAYFDNTTLGFDRGYDGIVNPTNNFISFYSLVGNENYRIQARPTFDVTDRVPLGYFSATTGTFSIGINNLEGVLIGQNVYLEDTLLNVTHDLKQGPYTFTSNYGTFNSRFVLKYTDTTLTNNTFAANGNQVLTATKNQQLQIKSMEQSIDSITVYDLLGRVIASKTQIQANETTINNLPTQQVLIVKIQLENGQVVSKKFSI